MKYNVINKPKYLWTLDKKKKNNEITNKDP